MIKNLIRMTVVRTQHQVIGILRIQGLKCFKIPSSTSLSNLDLHPQRKLVQSLLQMRTFMIGRNPRGNILVESPSFKSWSMSINRLKGGALDKYVSSGIST